MLKRRKKSSDLSQYNTPLTLTAENGALQRTFDGAIVDTFRRMATDLSCSEGLPRRIAVVAALQGEGVTHTALALATTLASDTAERYCLVDLNWWKPGMLDQLDPAKNVPTKGRGRKKAVAAAPTDGVPQRPGIAQVVAGTAKLDASLIATNLPNLFLLPSGELAISERPVLARSTGLHEVIDTLSKRFDHLVLDIPAILLTSDSIALASLGDACCLVVRHGVTPTPTVQRCLDHLTHMKMLGVIMNQATIKTPAWLRMLIPQE